MMRFQGVDIPSDVLGAQQEGRLVVFAGAGVSIPSPSNYPDFEGLVRAIGGATGALAKDPFEVLLGQFLERGIDVHARAQKLLSNPDSKFLFKARVEGRKQFAGNITHLLRNSAPEAALKEWSLWLKEYWDRRIDGVPVPVDTEELEEMIEWTVYLTPIFEEAVDRVCRSSPPLLQHTSVFRDLAKRDLPSSNPDAVLRLVRHLLKGVDSKSFLHCAYVDEIAGTLAASGANRPGLHALSDRLAEIGCIAAAARLKSLLGGSGTESS